MKRPYLRIFCHDKFKVTWIINATSHCKFPARLCIDGRKGVDLTNLQDYISALASIIEECPQTPTLIHKSYLVHKRSRCCIASLLLLVLSLHWHPTALFPLCRSRFLSYNFWLPWSHTYTVEPLLTVTGNIPETPELETPRYYRQNFGSQWCPL